MKTTRIEWTESTWNPVTGCTKISTGCKFCYAEVMSRRLKAMGSDKYANGFKLTLHPSSLAEPYGWKKPRVIFVNSMSDLFHKNVPVSYIQEVFKVIKENPRHIFQVLTKRSDLLLQYDREGLLDWPFNLWMGVSVENADALHRIDDLRKTGARVKFLSCEPLLSSLRGMKLKGIDWVIVGGESGRTPRPMQPEWVEEIRLMCNRANVAFYFKQWGGTNKKKTGRLLNGKKYDQMPETKSA